MVTKNPSEIKQSVSKMWVWQCHGVVKILPGSA